MIYSLEPIAKVLPELGPLMKEVWEEVDARAPDMKQEVDVDYYLTAEEVGMCRLYTVRSDAGKLIGFSVNLIQPIPHCKGKFCSMVDTMYIQPKHRGIGRELIKIIDEDLKEIGVTYNIFALKHWDTKEDLLEEVGYEHYEKMYKRML